MVQPQNPNTSTRPQPLQGEFNIGWISVLPREFIAASKLLDEEFVLEDLVQGADDNNSYRLGRIGKHLVVLNMPPYGNVGLVKAARAAADMKRTFPYIRFVLLVGIGGGSPLNYDIRLGDVVLGTKIIPIGQGKQTDDGAQVTGKRTEIPRLLAQAITGLMVKRENGLDLEDAVEKVKSRVPSNKPEGWDRPTKDRLYKQLYIHRPACDCEKEEAELYTQLVERSPFVRSSNRIQIHLGNIASSDQVVKSYAYRDQWAKREDIKCFEMEAAAVAEMVPCMTIRGIADYADGHKNDEWHPYAALAAAVCSKELLETISPQSVRASELTISGQDAALFVRNGIQNVTSSFHAFSNQHESEYRTAEKSRLILMDGSRLLQTMLEKDLEYLRALGSHAESCTDEFRGRLEDLESTRAGVEEMERLQREVQAAMAAIRVQSVRQAEFATDYVTRAEWERLVERVDGNTHQIEKWAEVSENGLSAVGKLLGTAGEHTGNQDLTIARRYLEHSKEFVGQIKNLDLKPFRSTDKAPRSAPVTPEGEPSQNWSSRFKPERFGRWKGRSSKPEPSLDQRPRERQLLPGPSIPELNPGHSRSSSAHAPSLRDTTSGPRNESPASRVSTPESGSRPPYSRTTASHPNARSPGIVVSQQREFFEGVTVNGLRGR